MDLDIELLIPGLFGLPGVPPPAATQTPALDRLFANARIDAARTRSGASKVAAGGPGKAEGQPAELGSGPLLRALGLKRAAPEGFPTAPYCLRADDPDWDARGVWMHADPVHLRADRDQLRLFDSAALGIRPDEATRLIEELNAHFAADEIRLHAPVPGRWYLRAPERVTFRAPSLRAVMGRTLADALPSGADAGRWNAFMNEAQMLMHASSVNQARAAAGQATINGLWLSGPGAYEPLTLAADIRLVVSEDPLCSGLAQAGDRPVTRLNDRALVESLADISSGRVLVVEMGLGDALRRRDLPAWEAALQRLDRQLAPVIAWCFEPRLLEPSGRPTRRFPVLRLNEGAGPVWTVNPSGAGWGRRLAALLRKRPAGSLAQAQAFMQDPKR